MGSVEVDQLENLAPDEINDTGAKYREIDMASDGKSLIRQLGADVCRKICTGQVIVSLANACRELIDNALDAGATQIDIRVKENGVELLEVLDNGSGIRPENYESLCKAHCTSKLAKTEDFKFLTTFGFRGEALNALASLSDVQITTRDEGSRCAAKLTFDHHGEIVSREQCSRQIGTTVSVGHLFKPLPVRCQELRRKARAEFLKLLECVQAFALSRTDCRFSCSNMASGKRSQILSSPGGQAPLREVLSSLFGARDKGTNFLELIDTFPNDEIQLIYGVRSNAKTIRALENIKLSGYVSSCESGQGRSSADRQFIYVNRRPVDFPRLCRIANEVYTLYNRGQYCTLVLFVDIPPATVDVNVSPDKRTVFLHHEKEVFAKFRASLLATFSKVQGNCPLAAITTKANKRSKFIPLLQWKENRENNEEADENTQRNQFSIPETQQSIDVDYLEQETSTQSTMAEGSDDQMRESAEVEEDEQSGVESFSQLSTVSTAFRAETSDYDFLGASTASDDHDGSFASQRNSGFDDIFGADVDDEEHDSESEGRAEDDNYGIGRNMAVQPAWTSTPVFSSSNAIAGGGFVSASTLLPARDGRTDLLQSPTSRFQNNFQDLQEQLREVEPVDEARTLPSTLGPAANMFAQIDDNESRHDQNAHANRPLATVTRQRPKVTPTKANRSASHNRAAASFSRSSVMKTLEAFSFQRLQAGANLTVPQLPLPKRSPKTTPPVERLRDKFAMPLPPGQQRLLLQSDIKMEQRNSPEVAEQQGHVAAEFSIEKASPADSVASNSARASGSHNRQQALRPQQTLTIDMAHFERSFLRKRKLWRGHSEGNTGLIEVERSEDMVTAGEQAAMAEQSDREAERHLSMMLRKTDFGRMEVLGQFNSAFILTRLGTEMFIVDQHAADEKYNFEELQKNSSIDSQPLIRPQPLRVGAVDEAILRDNLRVFHANGFEFTFADQGAGVALAAVPVLRGWQFDHNDIDELIGLLNEFPGVTHRPSKVRKIFASNACRKSVMFGDTLSKQQMEQIIRHMGTMDQPWNCPHGRPTIRHLCTMQSKSSAAPED